MFPLGSVLFPSAFLPLHVFEPRYREMVRACLAGDREFGVVLISRGSEVGGNDVRTVIGTVARIIEATELQDGRWALAAVGTRRIRVQAWLPDDPYPEAEVEHWDDEPFTATAADVYADVLIALRRVLALKAEVGDAAVEATIELADDPMLGSYQASAVSPFGPADQQRLLCAAGTDERLTMLATMLSEEEHFLHARIAAGEPEP